MASRNRLQPLNVSSFQGGVNLRADAFQLAEDEVQLALNVDIDPTSGFQSRRGWTRIDNGTLPAAWNPRAMHVQNFSTGEQIMVANGGNILVGAGPTFTPLQVATVDVPVSASPHLADFVAWLSSVYIACGKNASAHKWIGSGDAVALTASGPTWQDDYVAGGTGFFPKAELAATQHGYMFVANTVENSIAYPNRVRWSHPNNPEAWASTDYIDIVHGGEHITAIVPFGDRLIIFKPNAVFTLDGYDSDTWTASVVTMALGATHRQGVAVGEDAIYFLSYPQGIYELSRTGVQEISRQLRPALKDGTFNGGAINNTWLNWVNQRLYVGAPYSLTSTATDALTLMVWDPSLKGGAWVAHRGADSFGLGPMAYAAVSDRMLGCSRGTKTIVRVDANKTPVDDLNGTPTGFPMYVTTRWFDAGWPTVKKAWKRPEYVVKRANVDYYFDLQVHTDYNEAEPRRSFRVQVQSDGTVSLYDDGTLYDSGAEYGAAAAGSKLVRGSSLGLARSIRLTLSGELGKRWGVDAVLLKYMSRRYR